MKLTVAGKPISVSAKDAVGKGGEADVYDLHDGTALKVFKTDKDPDYRNDPDAQEGARRRLVEHQDKLPAFPTLPVFPNAPSGVVEPRELAYNGTRKIAGYVMDYLPGFEVLLRYGDRRFREQGGVDPNGVVDLFRGLRIVVSTLHGAGVVIGDFNDLNVLVDLGPARAFSYLIDADSFQFDRFLCHTFTPRFLDPLLSAPDRLLLDHPMTEGSDWYSYAVMLFQSLLYVGPYGGVHRPRSGPRLQHDQRVLRRITVFDPDVVYPKPALRYDVLPDELLDLFSRIFQKDERAGFPESVLAALRWTTCANCGAMHARPVCPSCATYVKKEPVVVRGNAKAKRVFFSEGPIVCVVYQDKLRYLYHDGSHFRREDGDVVTPGALHPDLRYRISGKHTFIARRNRVIAFPGNVRSDVDGYGHLPQVDANSRDHYWITPDGQLRGTVQSARYGLGERHLGDVLPGRTLFWVGEKFGFGFYRAGEITRAFVFSNRGMNDQVSLQDFRGELVDTTCAFSDRRCWFFATLQEGGHLQNHVYVIDASGTILTHRSIDQTEDDWLAVGIRGRFAAARSLYVPTDDGIGRVDEDDLSQFAKTFPDTSHFVDGSSYLLAGDGGIYVVGTHEITLLTIQ